MQKIPATNPRARYRVSYQENHLYGKKKAGSNSVTWTNINRPRTPLNTEPLSAGTFRSSMSTNINLINSCDWFLLNRGNYSLCMCGRPKNFGQKDNVFSLNKFNRWLNQKHIIDPVTHLIY